MTTDLSQLIIHHCFILLFMVPFCNGVTFPFRAKAKLKKIVLVSWPGVEAEQIYYCTVNQTKGKETWGIWDGGYVNSEISITWQVHQGHNSISRQALRQCLKYCSIQDAASIIYSCIQKRREEHIWYSRPLFPLFLLHTSSFTPLPRLQNPEQENWLKQVSGLIEPNMKRIS